MAVPKYMAAERCFVHVENSQEACLIEKGAVFEFSDIPNRHWTALNAEAAEALALLKPLPNSMCRSALPRLGDPAS